MSCEGKVYLVGAGPGDPSLLTVRAVSCLGRADIVIYDGLVSSAVVRLAPPRALRVYAGKKRSLDSAPLTQEQINELMVIHGRSGQVVVRLKGGDPLLFGRGGEECAALRAAGVPFEVIPGVSAAVAVPAYAGIPLTLRGVASTVALVPGHEAADRSPVPVNWAAIAGADTIVLFMALTTARRCAESLMQAGRAAETPVAAICWGTLPKQRKVIATLGTIAAEIEVHKLLPPALLVVGEVVACSSTMDWFSERALFGARIVATRPAEELLEFERLAAEFGAECIPAPVTRRQPCRLEVTPSQLRAQLAGSDWACFTSANAVSLWFHAIGELGLDARALAGVRVAAVGEATARTLADHGICVDYSARGGTGAALAEELVETKRIGSGARVYFPRATAGSDALPSILTASGANVELVSIYETVPVVPADRGTGQGVTQPEGKAAGDEHTCASPELVESWQLANAVSRLRAGTVDVLCAFAPSQVLALAGALGEGAAEILSAAKVIAAIGPTTASAFRTVGVRVDVVPAPPSISALLGAVADKYKEN